MVGFIGILLGLVVVAIYAVVALYSRYTSNEDLYTKSLWILFAGVVVFFISTLLFLF